jgi:LemA family protein
MTAFLIIIAVVVLLVFYVIGVYNGLKVMSVKADTAFADLDVVLKRRYDLIPNLVEVAKKYMSHESEVFSNIAKARSGYMEATTPEQKIEATKQFDKAMSTFKVQVEAYPELKADKTMGSLMTELTNTEDKIAYQREYYNRVVGTYNVKIEIFPSNIIAGMFNFTRKEFLKVESEEERKAVKVEF